MRIANWAICALVTFEFTGAALAQNRADAPCPQPAEDRPNSLSPEMNASTVAPPSSPLVGLPDPYREDFDWAKMPRGRVYGQTRAIAIDADGKSVWVFDRCSLTGNDCALPENKAINPIMEFDFNGQMMRTWGAGMFAAPHGIFVDSRDHIWTTDGNGVDPVTCQPIGNTLREFTAGGKMLMEIEGPQGGKSFTGLNDVVVDPSNGDVFVADGHLPAGHHPPANDRIMKFDSHGKYLMEWGGHGSNPENLSTPHGLAIDMEGRIYVADRGNKAVKVFDENGRLLNVWTQFGSPTAVYVRNETLYVADGAANGPTNPNFAPGVRIASVNDGKIVANIPYLPGHALEGVTVDALGDVYGANINHPRAVRWLVFPSVWGSR
jgi:DNA-binding beta-propeller fold protein YncE